MSQMSEFYVLYIYSNTVSIHYDFKCKWNSESKETLSLKYCFTTWNHQINQRSNNIEKDPINNPGGYLDQPPWTQCFHYIGVLLSKPHCVFLSQSPVFPLVNICLILTRPMKTKKWGYHSLFDIRYAHNFVKISFCLIQPLICLSQISLSRYFWTVPMTSR
jgi:hypothetical protein